MFADKSVNTHPVSLHSLVTSVFILGAENLTHIRYTLNSLDMDSLLPIKFYKLGTF